MDEIYNKIIELNGDCFSSSEQVPCYKCPFREKCLMKVLSGIPISNQTRIELALDAIIEEVILD